MKRTRVLVFTSLFIAMEIVLTRFLSIQTPIVRIGFGFIPIALSAIMFGPVVGGLTAALADILRMLLFPSGFAYFPGFTFSALLTGVIYGAFLYNKPKSLVRVALAVLTVVVVVDLGLNSLWVSMITGAPFIANIVPRVIKSAIMYPLQVFMIFVLYKYLQVFIRQISTNNKRTAI